MVLPASLLYTDNTENHHVELINWLLSQGFNYRYYDPETGEVYSKNTDEKGVAQGADISAYLANISLFELDAQVQSVIEKINADEDNPGIHAAYARYVDDMLIICDNAYDADRLERLVQAELLKCGLHLNRKFSSPPPLTKDQAYEWLVSDRGAGFGVSGKLAEMPTTLVDPLEDADGMDRKGVLRLLADSTFDSFPKGDLAEVELQSLLTQLNVAMQVDNLRFSEQVSAMRRVWLYAANLNKDTPDKLFETVERLWSDIKPKTLIEDSVSSTDDDNYWLSNYHAMAYLEGLERYIRLGTVDDMFLVSDYKKDYLDTISTIKKAVEENDLFKSIINSFESNGRELPVFILNRLAAMQLLLKSYSNLTHFSTKYKPSQQTFMLSLSTNAKEVTTFVSHDNIFGRLHEAIARMTHAVALNETETDPIDNLSNVNDSSSADEYSFIEKIIKYWSPDTSETPKIFESDFGLDKTQKQISLNTFFNILGKKSIEFLHNRQHMLGDILGDHNSDDFLVLPTPPDKGDVGVLIWHREDQILFVLSNQNSIEAIRNALFCSEGLDGLQALNGEYPVNVFQVKYNNKWTCLIDRTEELSKANLPDIAAQYRRFIAKYDMGDSAHILITPYSFFETSNNNGEQNNNSMIIAWYGDTFTTEDSGNGVECYAYARLVSGGLDLQPIKIYNHKNEFGYRRIGISLKDLYTVNHSSEEIPHDIEHAEQARSYVLGRAFFRIADHGKYPLGIITEENLPTAIERALSWLEQFKEEDGYSTALFEAFSESTILQSLYMRRDLLKTSGSGQSIDLLRRIANDSTPNMYRLRKFLVPQPVDFSHNWRRTTQAFFAISKHLEVIVNENSDNTNTPALRILQNSYLILALYHQLYGLLCEGLAIQDPNIPLFQSQQDIMMFLPAESEVLLLFDKSSSREDRAITSQWKKIADLLKNMHEKSSNPSLISILKSITPLGLLIAWRMLIQYDLDDDAEKNFVELRKLLSSSIQTNLDANATFENFLQNNAFEKLLSYTAEDLIKMTQSLENAISIEVCIQEGKHLPLSKDSMSSYEYQSEKGRYILSAWQQDVGQVKSLSKREGGEYYYPNDSKAKSFIWSESTHKDQVQMIHGISSTLSELASLKNISTLERNYTEIESHNRHTGEHAANSLPEAPSKEVKHIPNATSRDSNSKGLDSWKKKRQVSWKGRMKAAPYQRMALFQWGPNCSYEEPNECAEILESQEEARQVILLEVLEACNQFGVDGIVLPEYAVRMETVNWLMEQCRQKKYKFVIWAGSLRVPSTKYYAIQYNKIVEVDANDGEVYQPHHAMIFAIDGNSGDPKLYVREKRYPSVAANEVIRPPINRSEAIEPLLEKSKDLSLFPRYDIRHYALELICSEMFTFSSPANMHGAIRALQQLEKQFYSLEGDNIEARIKNDWIQFSNYTSVINPMVPCKGRGEHDARRSLIIIPAMTTRSSDYHIFGQNQMLAAGLVSVFCNSTTYANGGSCFIGVDGAGTKIKGEKIPELPKFPYHGPLPGIYHYCNDDAGSLTKKEMSLVIADLLVENTQQSKPKPQYSQHPLELVAHIPVILANKSNPDKITELKSNCNQAIDQNNKSSNDNIMKIIEFLANYEGNSESWLSCRKKAYTESKDLHPCGFLPPAAIDWILIEDDIYLKGKKKQ